MCCVLYSAPYDRATADRYLYARAGELNLGLDGDAGRMCETIYIGGGTPLVLRDTQWEEVLDAILERLAVAGGCASAPPRRTLRAAWGTVMVSA